jgi:TolB-like protein
MRNKIFNFRSSFFILVLLTGILLSDSPLLFAYEKEIKSLSSSMAESLVKASKKTIAVADFTDLQGNVTELGRFLGEEFSVALAGAGKSFEVVDRTHLKTLLKEHKLGETGIIDPSTAKKLGQIAGVDTLITGTITPFGDSIRLSVKLLDAATAKVIWATTGDIAKTKAIEELLGRGVEAGARGQETTTTIPSTVAKAVEEGEFIFRPLGCKRLGSQLVCTISVINNSIKTKRQGFGGPQYWKPSKLYDNFGNQYSVYVQIGARKTHIANPFVSENFPPKLPINIQFIAQDVDSGATYMSLVLDSDGFSKPVAIRDIPITK